jgi:hypothetical protein
LVALARAMGENVPTTPPELQTLLATATTAGSDDRIIEVMWDLFHHVDFEGEIYDAVGDGLDGAVGQLGTQRDILDALEMFQTDELKAQGILELEKLLESDDQAIATRAAGYLSTADNSDARRLDLARIGSTSPDLRVQAVARYMIADLAADLAADWQNGMLFAIDHGDAFISSAAAGDFGAQIADDRLAYFYLERALRSPLLEVARNAASSIATLFADDSEVASVYARRAEEIDSLIVT